MQHGVTEHEAAAACHRDLAQFEHAVPNHEFPQWRCVAIDLHQRYDASQDQAVRDQDVDGEQAEKHPAGEREKGDANVVAHNERRLGDAGRVTVLEPQVTRFDIRNQTRRKDVIGRIRAGQRDEGAQVQPIARQALAVDGLNAGIIGGVGPQALGGNR